ncbi:MAG TPA: GNAT family N-acetyltransferase [Sphingomonas sp.]|jgi:ribosomal protein S18 acetylase RimI-like enzyme|uniref:GNAT family N-acetyltransferase n=1 Tax=Sphingomonas sp. TaxID=28214 RepID=UPI002EDAF395
MTIAMQCRLAGADDAEALAVIGGATFLETFADSIVGVDLLAHIRDRHAPSVYAGWLDDPGSRCWLGETETGAPVGYAVLTAPDLPPALAGIGDLELKRIYLLSIAHRGGNGAAMMQAVLAEAGVMGARRVLLGVYGENHRAIGFYRRMGFVETGRRVFTVGTQVYDDLVFARAV